MPWPPSRGATATPQPRSTPPPPNLQRLSASAASWKGQAGPTFAKRSGDLAGRIGKAQQRYAAASRALQHCADRLAETQPVAYSAVREAQLADAATQRAHAAALQEATARLASATTSYETAKGEYRSAASRAADLLREGRSGDGLKDSWFHRNTGWTRPRSRCLAPSSSSWPSSLWSSR